MELDTFFFDTYAFFEILEGNDNYEKYKIGVIVMTRLNLVELHYGLLRIYGKDEADRSYDRLLPYVVHISDQIVKNANGLRLTHKKRKLSYVDCIGYTIAAISNISFLTEDKQFENLENFEFVK